MSYESGLFKIDEVVVGGGGAATIPFSTINQRYRSLLLDLVARGDNATNSIGLQMQCNGDTAANYNWEYLGASTGTPSGAGSVGVTSMTLGFICAASAPTNAAGIARIDIPNYSGTVFRKRLLFQTAYQYYDASGDGGNTYIGEAEWRSTAAITSILLFPASGNFVEGSVCSLYGIL